MMSESSILYLLMAVLLTNWRAVCPQDALRRPRISLDEKTGVYCEGDIVSFLCAGGGDAGNRTFELYRDKATFPSHRVVTEESRATFAINASERLVNYHCRYAREIEGALVLSAPSKTVRVFVTSRNVKPELRQERRSVKAFAQGERLGVVCAARTGSVQPYFELYRWEGGTPVATQRAEYKSPSVTFDIRDIAKVGTENYTCGYWRWVSGREIRSQQSDPLPVMVIERPPKPQIGPGGAYRIFLRGETVLVRCSSLNLTGNATFLLYQEGTRKAVASQAVEAGVQSATFDVTDIQGSGFKHYACGYTQDMWEREIESRRSDSVKMVVEIPLVKPYLSMEGFTRMFEVGESARIACQGAFQDWDSTFYLYRDGEDRLLISGTPRALEFSVTFDIKDVMRNGTEFYSCTYRRRLTDRMVYSQRSNSLGITAR
ncbi:uncharacterized protein LOC144488311, partial [Mustelus asterias]